MMTISVDLGPKLEGYVSALVEAGVYESNDAVLRDAVRMIQDREARLKQLDAAIERGIAAADGGGVSSVQDVRERLRGSARRNPSEI